MVYPEPSSLPPTLEATDNIAWHLHAMARRNPDQLAVVVPEGRSRGGRVCYSHLTYRQLDQDSDRIALGLGASGIAPGTRAAVMVSPGLDFFALTFALFKAGVVPVLIDPGMGVKSLGKCLKEAAPELFIGISKAVWARHCWAGEKSPCERSSWSRRVVSGLA